MDIKSHSSIISEITAPPFEWQTVTEGRVSLEDASPEGGTRGGVERVAAFWMARYPVTNAQFRAFLTDPEGYEKAVWWEYSPQGRQWHFDHPKAKPTAFPGDRLPRTRVNWFESMAFCAWLSAKIAARRGQVDGWLVRLPTEAEWQRAAVGDSGWCYPWGNAIDPTHANYGKQVGQPTPVDQYPQGESPFGMLDMVGNVWERCLSSWGKTPATDLSGYTLRAMRGGAWNVSNTEYLKAVSRYGHPVRGQLNDAGFRVVFAKAV